LIRPRDLDLSPRDFHISDPITPAFDRSTPNLHRGSITLTSVTINYCH